MQHMTPILQNPVIPHFAGEREDSRGELSSYWFHKFAAREQSPLAANNLWNQN